MIVVLNFLPPTLGDQKQQKSKMDHLKVIDDLRKELKENPKVHVEIAQKYQVDLEVVIHTECNEHLRKQQHNVKILQKFKFSSYITTRIMLETVHQVVHRTCRVTYKLI